MVKEISNALFRDSLRCIRDCLGEKRGANGAAFFEEIKHVTRGGVRVAFVLKDMKHKGAIAGEADAVGKVQRWHNQYFQAEYPVPFVLNVAGPRESKSGGIQKQTRKFISQVLQGMMTE